MGLFDRVRDNGPSPAPIGGKRNGSRVVKFQGGMAMVVVPIQVGRSILRQDSTVALVQRWLSLELFRGFFGVEIVAGAALLCGTVEAAEEEDDEGGEEEENHHSTTHTQHQDGLTPVQVSCSNRRSHRL